jgi:SNF2 family DNA or RNA helicase
MSNLLLKKSYPPSKRHEQLTKIREEEEEIKIEREKISKALADKEAELSAKRQLKYELARAFQEAEKKISEAEHAENERLKELAINEARNARMQGLKHHLDELNPEYMDYAFEHQWEGASTLALHGSGLLADDMGLGKTLEAIMFMDMVQSHRTLIVTPSETCNNFTIEMMMWAKHRYTWTLANQNKIGRRVMLDAVVYPRVESGQDFTITINYEQLYGDPDFYKELLRLQFDTIIIDEAHNFKNKKSVLFDKLQGLCHAQTTKHVLPMTGTFIVNKPQDIWPALNLIDQDAFPTERQFLNWYCYYSNYDSRWVFRDGGVESMMRRLGGRIVKRTMEEAGIKLPEQHIHNVELAFDEAKYADQQMIIKQLAEHSQIILDMHRKTNVIDQLALITRQRQAIVWPASIVLKNPEGDVVFSVGEEVQESIKIDWAEAKIRELLAQGKRIAVFSQFTGGINELQRRLGKDRTVIYDGNTPNDVKIEAKKDFDRRHVTKNGGFTKWDVALCNFKSGGVGLNFTDITETIILDEGWSPAMNEQAYRRTKRIGQTEETHVYIPRVNRSIDTWMKRLIDIKGNMVDGFNETVDLTKELVEFFEVIKNG